MGSKLRTIRRLARLAGPGLVVWALAEELRKPAAERTWTGRLAGVVPYDFRAPTFSRMRGAVWAPDDDRLFTPQAFGVGWSVNLARAAAMARR